MIEEIINSKIKIKIATLLARMGGPLSVSDVARTLNISKSRSSECLRELEKKGLLEHKTVGRSKVYSLSVSTLSMGIKTALSSEDKILQSVEDNFVHECAKLRPISIALFGSAISGLKFGSDIDILVIHNGYLDSRKIYDLASDITVKSGIRVSPLVLVVNKFITGVKGGEEVMINILANYKLLYGKDLEELVWHER
jgi:predicted nucleotidyltransferase